MIARRSLIAEDAVPLDEREVGRHDDAALFVAVGDHLEEQPRPVHIRRKVAPFVDDQEVALFDAATVPRPGVVVVSRLELLNEVRHAAEHHLVPKVAGLDPKGGSQVRLTRAGHPHHHEVLAFLDEVAACEGTEGEPVGIVTPSRS